VRATVRATFNGNPVRDLLVRFAGGAAKTNLNGVATVFTRLERPGRFKAYASRNDVYGLSSLVPVGMSQAASAERAALPPFGAG
jgi:hypothetical protein